MFPPNTSTDSNLFTDQKRSAINTTNHHEHHSQTRMLSPSVVRSSSPGSGRGVVAQTRKYLPAGYKLGDNDVYCGRGSLCFNHIGNRRFRMIVSANLGRYSSALTKTDKTSIIYEVVDYIRSTSPHGGFVKKDIESGRYYEVGDFLAVSFALHEVSIYYFSAWTRILQYHSFLHNRERKRHKHFVMRLTTSTSRADLWNRKSYS